MESAALPAVLVVADTGRPSSVRARARRVHSVRYFSGLFTFCISTVLSRGSATKAAQYRSARAHAEQKRKTTRYRCDRNLEENPKGDLHYKEEHVIHL